MPTKIVRKARPRGELTLRERHRASVLTTLVEVCRGWERLQGTEAARAACREERVLLEQVLARDPGEDAVSGAWPAGEGRG